MRPLKILGLGDNTVDTYVDLGRQFPGGNAVNVAVMTARMGAAGAYMGCFGTDETGDLVWQALAAEGLDLSHCRRVDGKNARAFIAHNDGDRRFIRSEPGTRGRWNAFDASDLAYIGGFDLVHSSIYSELEPFLPQLRRHIRQLSFDFSERWTGEAMVRFAHYVDIAFLSHPDGSDEDCEAMLRRCVELGPKVAVATRGARGAIALANGKIARRGAVQGSIVDTLGAGDALISGFLVAVLNGASLDDALATGAQAAAMTCTSYGAFGHGTTWQPTGTERAN